MNKKQMAARLTARSVPWQSWGADGTKTFEDLYGEYEHGEMALDFDELVRDIRTLLLHVFVDIVSDKEQVVRKKILELKRKEGAKWLPRKGHNASLSEKIRFLKGETSQEAVLRGLREELDLRHRQTNRPIEFTDLATVAFFRNERAPEVAPSDSYPGLRTRNRISEATWVMPHFFYLPSGHLERRNEEIISVFKWVPTQSFRGRIEDAAPVLYG